MELRRGRAVFGAILGASVLAGCWTPTPSYYVDKQTDGREDQAAEPPEPPEPPVDPDRATVTHSFGTLHLDAFEERQPCGSWTLNNEEAIYVNVVTLANEGAWHHSNWFVVPETYYAGEDGFWNCSDRGFAEIESAIVGTVLFAQSTQSWVEEQRLSEGAVIKIPPHHKVVGGLHALNLAPRELDTELRMSFDIIHPKLVEKVLTPLRLSYLDLQIPPQSESRFSSMCDLEARYQTTLHKALDMKIHWVLPHYHYLGNFFELSIAGGPRDGEVLFQLEGFNAEANGKNFPDPIDLTGATGLNFTCGYDNPSDQEVGWGVGDQEMCVMLALVEADMLIDGSVVTGTLPVGEVDGIPHFEANCVELGVPKNTAQSMPSEAELEAELYIPPSNVDDDGLPPVPECVDTPPEASPIIESTLTAIRENIFVPTCTFSSCHGTQSKAAGLDLEQGDIRTALINHETWAQTEKPLVDPGNAANSWIFDLLSDCTPMDDAGGNWAHMPRNAPILLEPGLVAAVRQWIDAGALDN